MIAGHDPRYRHLEVEVILAARVASRRRRREAARQGFDQEPGVGVEGGRLTDAVGHRRVVLALWAMALACLVTLAMASAADSQLHQTDADLLYDAATMDTDANGCMEQLW